MVQSLHLRQRRKTPFKAQLRAKRRRIKVKITRKFTEALNGRDETITKGFDFCGDHFDVHRYHPPLVYGRRGDCEVGEGICLIRGKDKESSEIVYMVLCYALPIVSARAIPQGIEFFNTYGKNYKLVKLKRLQNKINCFNFA